MDSNFDHLCVSEFFKFCMNFFVCLFVCFFVFRRNSKKNIYIDNNKIHISIGSIILSLSLFFFFVYMIQNLNIYIIIQSNLERYDG